MKIEDTKFIYMYIYMFGICVYIFKAIHTHTSTCIEREGEGTTKHSMLLAVFILLKYSLNCQQ